MALDLHAHLLWNIDDGPASESESIEMIRRLMALGFTGAAPSPHGDSDPTLARARLDELRAALERERLDFELFDNTENALTPELVADLCAGRGRMLAKTRFFLVELPFHGPLPALGNILERLSQKGLNAIVAHPERSAHFAASPFAAASVVHRFGGLLQLDLGSLVGVYGTTAERTARALLKGGHYDLAASDLHRPADCRWLAHALDELDALVGPATARRLIDFTPRRIVRGDPPV